MTYTIIARCPRTARLGAGLATYSLGVGGYRPFVRTAIAALSARAYANPELGPLGVGFSGVKTLAEWSAALVVHDDAEVAGRDLRVDAQDVWARRHLGET